jgi:hypothetical protein
VEPKSLDYFERRGKFRTRSGSTKTTVPLIHCTCPRAASRLLFADPKARQVSKPFELRLLLACRADAFGAITSLFVSEVFCWQREPAREDGLTKNRYEALSLERLSNGLDGNVIYQVEATPHGNETQRVMSPMQFMGRWVALIPPPYHQLLRYFGVFGPHAARRKAVVPNVAPAAEQQHDRDKSSVTSTSKPGSLDPA